MARGPSAVGVVVLRHFSIAKLAHVLVAKLGQVFNDLPHERQNRYKQRNLLVLGEICPLLQINPAHPQCTAKNLAKNQMSIEPYKKI